MRFLESGDRFSSISLLCLLAIAAFLRPAFGQTKKEMDMPGQTQDTLKSAAPKQERMAMNEGEMEFVHPFFTHMGMPDPVGQYSLRLSGVAARMEGETEGDFGFHLETGLMKRVGLHIRNDRVLNNAHTEIAIQYAALQSDDGMQGISPFVEVEIPTHQNEHDAFVLVGLSSMWSTHRFEMNQSIEYSPKEDALEGSIAVVGKVEQRFSPVLEFVLATAKDVAAENSMIAGLKYQVNKPIALGIGYQFPVTEAKEFTDQILLQTDLEW